MERIFPAGINAASGGLAGIVIGVLFLNLLDLITPHLHKITGMEAEEHKNNASLNHVLLFVMAIALHKLPEGIAAGRLWMVQTQLKCVHNCCAGMVIIK